jgi:hypothetical protein
VEVAQMEGLVVAELKVEVVGLEEVGSGLPNRGTQTSLHKDVLFHTRHLQHTVCDTARRMARCSHRLQPFLQ